MKNYKTVLTKKDNKLLYYIFDWDDNVLFMPTKIYVDKYIKNRWVNKSISTMKFRDIYKHIDNYNNKIFGLDEHKYMWRFRDNDMLKSLYEFRDYGKRGEKAFKLDVIKAVKRKSFGPSYQAFIHTLIDGRIFLICTARGHEPKNIKSGIEYIIFNYLTAEQKELMKHNLNDWGNTHIDNFRKLIHIYLNKCWFIATDSTYFKNTFKINNNISTSDAKKIAIEKFVGDVYNKYKNMYKNAIIKVGFSDDTQHTLIQVEKLMKEELILKYPIDYYIIDTSNGDIQGGVKKKI